ncbi:MAG TPA: dTDP-4-dehydrorhamnose reductase [Candidatus Doudnabacteria bacterium]|nr:dTDP-4-dehydrorhamnose reductase [Candidatus Doudnabacteria bacterium]
MKFLIIGKNGNLGKEFINALTSEDFIAFDSTELDITDINQVRSVLLQHRPDIILNCAAYTAVDKAETEFETAKKVNAEGPENLAKICMEIDSTLVHFSTGMVFIGDNGNGYNELDKTNPVNAYGKSKLLGEQLIQSTNSKHYIIRTEWLYAMPQNSSAKKSFNEIILDLAKSGQPLKGVADEVGQPTWTKDLVEATLQLIEQNLPYGIYHIANSGKASRLEWAQEILKLNGIDLPIEPVSGKSFPRPAARPQFELLNNTKLPQLRDWKEALKEYFNN